MLRLGSFFKSSSADDYTWNFEKALSVWHRQRWSRSSHLSQRHSGNSYTCKTASWVTIKWKTTIASKEGFFWCIRNYEERHIIPAVFCTFAALTMSSDLNIGQLRLNQQDLVAYIRSIDAKANLRWNHKPSVDSLWRPSSLILNQCIIKIKKNLPCDVPANINFIDWLHVLIRQRIIFLTISGDT